MRPLFLKILIVFAALFVFNLADGWAQSGCYVALENRLYTTDRTTGLYAGSFLTSPFVSITEANCLYETATSCSAYDILVVPVNIRVGFIATYVVGCPIDTNFIAYMILFSAGAFLLLRRYLLKICHYRPIN